MELNRSLKKFFLPLFFVTTIVALFVNSSLSNDKLLSTSSNTKALSEFNNIQKVPIDSLLNRLKSKYNYVGDLSDGMIKVRLGEYPDEKWGFVNDAGIEIVKPKYSIVEDFKEGMAAVANWEQKEYLEDGKKFYHQEAVWGFINSEGEEVVKPQYTQVGNFSEGLAVIYKLNPSVKGDDQYYSKVLGYIDTKGDIVIPTKFDRITPTYHEDDQYDPYLSSFFEGKAFVQFEKKYGAISRTGDFVLKPKYEEISDGVIDSYERFTEGLLAVKLNGKWGFINKKYEEVIKPAFDKVEDFNNGYSIVQKGGTEQVIFEMSVERIGSKYGIIDKTGNVVVPIKYTKIRRTDGGEFEAYEGGKEILDESKEEYIYYKGGKWIKLKLDK